MRKGDPDVYEYVNYRKYLRRWFKIRNGRPSQRGFAMGVGCSPSLVAGVVKGTRNLNGDYLDAFGARLRLGAERRRYFNLLVALNQARSKADEEAAWHRIATTRRFRKAHRVLGDRFALMAEWYHGVILELSRCRGFRPDPQWIARALQPRITPAQARAALERLVSVGLLRERDGALTPTDEMLVIADGSDPERAEALAAEQVQQLALHKLHRWFIQRAPAAMEEFTPSERMLNGGTLAVSEELLPELFEDIAAFQKRLLEKALTGQGEPTRVYQLNIQFFPLSQRTGEP